MRAGLLARQWCELLQEEKTRTATGATKTELVSKGKVRCYRIKSRPYTYWQEKRAEERFVDWRVELLIRHDYERDWTHLKVRYNDRLYRVMWYEIEMGQTRVLLRMDNE